MLEHNSIKQIILFTLYSLQKEHKNCSFSRLVRECFNNFPQVFALEEYRQWPDTRKLDRPLRDLRKRKLIKGNPQTYFSLTVSGKKLAQTISKSFCQQKLNFK